MERPHCPRNTASAWPRGRSTTSAGAPAGDPAPKAGRGSYSMTGCTVWATMGPARRAVNSYAVSMGALTPAAPTCLPSTTTRSGQADAPHEPDSSTATQCPVAARTSTHPLPFEHLRTPRPRPHGPDPNLPCAETKNTPSARTNALRAVSHRTRATDRPGLTPTNAANTRTRRRSGIPTRRTSTTARRSRPGPGRSSTAPRLTARAPPPGAGAQQPPPPTRRQEPSTSPELSPPRDNPRQVTTTHTNGHP